MDSSTYIVETPASIAEERVNAVNVISNGKQSWVGGGGGYIQHINPMKNANRMTGAVYCPLEL